jgi:hypothetical protein
MHSFDAAIRPVAKIPRALVATAQLSFMIIATEISAGTGLAKAVRFAEFLGSNDLSKGRFGAPSGFLFKGNML